jgi:Holliday junction resolvasome RuvABC ATP-dependent DNA helicase subunit
MNRPTKLAAMIGQDKVREQLRVNCRAVER